MATPYLQIVPQRHPMDCGVACLAMLLGLSYEEVLMAFRHNVLAKGATLRQITDAARRLQRPVRWFRQIDLEGDTGILSVTSDQWPTDHLVVLKEGWIVDTDGTLWEAADYCTAYSVRPTGVLKERENE